MKIAVFGSTGQVATELGRRAPEGIELQIIDRTTCDLSRPDQVALVTSALNVDAVINAAAYTAVDRAETEPNLANTINGTSVGVMGVACNDLDIPLVHVSTDYVFDGSGDSPRLPTSATNPVGAYGESKLLGETLLAQSGARHTVLRTSWVFSAHGANFVKSMLRLGASHEKLRVVDDQIGGPTPAAAIADALYMICLRMADGHAGGVYHFAGTPDVSWADFAKTIFEDAGMDISIECIPTTEYPTPARRPLNSRLDCESLFNDFAIARPDWHAGLKDVLKELRE